MSKSAHHAAALERLITSRARLARQLLPAPPRSGDEQASGSGAASSWTTPRRWRAQWRLWTRRGPLVPVFLAVEHGLGMWWRRHPWRETATVVGELGAANVRPLIRRHPLAAIGVGAAAGAAIAWSQPWRWRPVRVHATRSTRQALSWALAQLGQPAVQMLIAGFLVSKAGATVTDTAARDAPAAVADLGGVAAAERP